MEREKALSPCIGVCELNEHQVCVGCGRSIAEIATWGQRPIGSDGQVLDRLQADWERPKGS